MKRKSSMVCRVGLAGLLAMIAALLLGPSVFAQGRWVRLESDNKGVSFALPENYLVSEERTTESKTKTLSGFLGGVSFEASVSDHRNSKSNLRRILIDDSRKPAVLEFELEGIAGKSVTYGDRGYEHSIYLASNNGYYALHIASKSKDCPEVSRFLRSIRAKGKALFKAGSGTPETEDEPISMRSLEVSRAVEEARERKVAKLDRKITFKPLASYVPCSQDLSVRPAFIVSRGRPDLAGLGPSMTDSGEIRMNVQLLAGGQVGDIVVFSDLEKRVLRAFAEGEAKMRFIPAQDDGTPVDSCETVRNAFGVTRSIRVFTVR